MLADLLLMKEFTEIRENSNHGGVFITNIRDYKSGRVKIKFR